MAWQDESVPLLRTILGDAGCGVTNFTDTRLEELLIAAAYLVAYEIPFSTTYTVRVSQQSITPDPADDAAFINFIVLKAACLADEGTYRSKSLLAGLQARCGPTMLDTSNYGKGFQTLLTEGPCKAYEDLKQDALFGNTDVIRAILSPFRGNDFDPSSLRIEDISNEVRDRNFF
jgi:hypothetical protein